MQTTPASSSSSHSLLAMKPAQKTKKTKAHEICNNNYILIHQQNTIFKNEKNKRKKNPRICQGRQISPSCNRPYFVPDFSCVCGWVCEHKRRASARGRTRAHKDTNEIIGRALCCNGSVGTRLSPSFRPSHLPYVPTYFPTYLPF